MDDQRLSLRVFVSSIPVSFREFHKFSTHVILHIDTHGRALKKDAKLYIHSFQCECMTFYDKFQNAILRQCFCVLANVKTV